MNNLVVYEAPRLRNLPAALTPEAIGAASLPLKVEAARRAIAECENLDELLYRKDQVEAMAAAIKTLRHTTPEMVRSINRMCKEAVLKLGQLVDAYAKARPAAGGDYMSQKLARSAIREKYDVKSDELEAASRLFNAPAKMRDRIMDDDNISHKPTALKKHLPVLKGGGGGGWRYCYHLTVASGIREAAKRLESYDLKALRDELVGYREEYGYRKKAISEVRDALKAYNSGVASLRAALEQAEAAADAVEHSLPKAKKE